jgi:outer membrane protein TolC
MRAGPACVMILGLALLLLPGCQTFSPDGGMDAVAGIVGREIDQDAAALRTPEAAQAARARVAQLLRRRLTADAAVQVALLNNRGLQAAYNELGIAEAAMVEASLPPSPGLSVQRIAGSAEVEIERRIVADILALATLPVRARIAADRFRQAQLRAAETTLRLAAATRRAYYRAVGTRELVGFLTQAKSAAETGTELAKRLGETGAMNKLDQAREQVFYAETTAQLAAAQQRAQSEREQLVRLMGLWGDDLDFKLPDALPALPRRPKALPQIEIEALRRRLDLQAARLELAALAHSLKLTQATRFVNRVELSGVARDTRERATGARINDRGFDLELQIPLFDFGETRLREASETYMASVNRLADLAVIVRSQSREAYRRYRSSYDIAAHYQREVLPLRKIISDETQLRLGAMQIDEFALLAEGRARIASTIASIGATRDFWLAESDLSAALAVGAGGGGEGLAGTGNETFSPVAAGGGGSAH